MFYLVILRRSLRLFYLVITSFYEISLYNSLYIFNAAELFVDLRSRIRFCGSLSVSRFGRIIDPEAENENYEDALEHSYFFLSRLFLLPSSPEIRARLLATPRIAGERLSLRDDLLRVLSLAFLVFSTTFAHGPFLSPFLLRLAS